MNVQRLIGDSHLLCPKCFHEYGFHNSDGICRKGCCNCSSESKK